MHQWQLTIDDAQVRHSALVHMTSKVPHFSNVGRDVGSSLSSSVTKNGSFTTFSVGGMSSIGFSSDVCDSSSPFGLAAFSVAVICDDREDSRCSEAIRGRRSE